MSYPMKNRNNPDLPPRLKTSYLTLRPKTIEKVFADCVMDLKEVIVLDSIDILSDSTGFRIRCHDLYGPLPEILVKDSGNSLQDKDQIANQACKLVSIVRLRNQMTRWLAGGKFLPPTKMDSRAMVGFRAGSKTWLAEGKDSLAAYHELHRQVVG
jgi:hypothetical protein